MADISIEMVPRMLFLVFSNVNIQFDVEKLTWRSYAVAEVLSTISQVEIINKKEFAQAALDKNSEKFVVHVATLAAETLIY